MVGYQIKVMETSPLPLFCCPTWKKGNYRKKIFCTTHGKRDSGSKWKHGKELHGMELTLVGDKWERRGGGVNVTGAGWLGIRENFWALHLYPCSVVLPVKNIACLVGMKGGFI